MTLMVQPIAPKTEGAQRFLAAKKKKMLIGGEWVDALSGKTFDTINPATGEVLAHVPEAAAEDVNKAVAAAKAAFENDGWRRMVPQERAKLLWRAAELIDAHLDELSELETLDQGKPFFVGRWAEIPMAAEQFRYHAGMCTKVEGTTIPSNITYAPPGKRVFQYTQKEPVGVVAAITPWNSPLIMHAMKLAPALAAGCTVILKPAEDTSLTALRLAELLLEAGFPAGVVNVVTGYGHVVGAALAAHPHVDKVAFTGSTQTGRAILDAAKSNLKKVTLELGGKSPVIVMDDADLDLAIPGVANAIFFNSGQVCVAGSRVYAQENVFDKLVAGVAEIAKSMKMGHGLDPNTQLGPLVSKKQAERVKGFVDGGRKDGLEVVAGGQLLGESGTFFQPTVVTKTRPDMLFMREEIFGPVVAIEPVSSLDDIVAQANDTHYGLAASVWTQNLSAAHRLADGIRAGTVWVNCHSFWDVALPVGGYKESGWGRESGKMAIENYLETKSVCMVL
jgi:phenylacetaldehyde dehydrogenase